MDNGIEIRQQRERTALYCADQIRIIYTHCGQCGARLSWGKCPYGCSEQPEKIHFATSLSGFPASGATPDIARKHAEELEQDYDADCGAGNWTRDEQDDMRHPQW